MVGQGVGQPGTGLAEPLQFEQADLKAVFESGEIACTHGGKFSKNRPRRYP